MSPVKQSVFNARVQGTKFDFDARKLSPRASEANSYGSESTPMLTLNNLPRSGSESDHEGSSSPYMNMCPRIEEESDEVFEMKQNNARNMQPSAAVTNPTYITFTSEDEKKPQNFSNTYINVNNVPNGLVKWMSYRINSNFKISNLLDFIIDLFICLWIRYQDDV